MGGQGNVAAIHIPRPTPLPNGMESWLNNGVLDQLNPDDRAKALTDTITLLKPILCDADGNWTADYVRLRFHASDETASGTMLASVHRALRLLAGMPVIQWRASLEKTASNCWL